MTKANIVSVTAIVVTVGLASGGWIFNAGKVSEKINKTDKIVTEAVEQVEYEHDVNIQQTAILDNMLDRLDRDSKSVDKELDRIYKKLETR